MVLKYTVSETSETGSETMTRNEKLCPPYAGDLPFLYLCCSESDTGRVLPLLKRLYARGCRVWYPTGAAQNLAERERRNARMHEAKLVVLYQTKRARLDRDVKSALLVCQANGIPIVSIDTDDAESSLSMGLNPQTVHITSDRPKAIEAALLRSEGFSQELLDEPKKVRDTRLLKIAAALLFVTLALTGAVFLFRRAHQQPPQPPVEEPTDTVVFADSKLTETVRDALGGGLLTEESVQSITELRLSALPADTDALLLLPNLTRIEIPQSDAERALALLDRYTVVLYGGDA